MNGDGGGSNEEFTPPIQFFEPTVAFTVALVLVSLVTVGGFAYAASKSIVPPAEKAAKERVIATPVAKDRLAAELPRNKDLLTTLPVRRPEGKGVTVTGVLVELPGRGLGLLQGMSFYPVIPGDGVNLKEHRGKVVQARLLPKENAWVVTQVKALSPVRVVTPKAVRKDPRQIRSEPKPPIRVQPAPKPPVEKIQPLPKDQSKEEPRIAK